MNQPLHGLQAASAPIPERVEMLDQASDAIAVLDLDGHTVFWNRSAARLYGWTVSEVLHRNLAERICSTNRAPIEEARRTVLTTGEWSGELEQTARSGSTFIVQSRWSLIRDAEGLPESILVINTDVTGAKQLEAQFLRAHRSESIGSLARGIAHDLNNVLAPIILGVDLLQTKVQDAICCRMLKTMAASAKRGAGMVRQVMAFAQGQEGEPRILQLSQVIQEMRRVAIDTLPPCVELKVQMADGLWPIVGDATRLRRVVENLCVHARAALPDGGVLRVEGRNFTPPASEEKQLPGPKPMRYVLLSFTESGPGGPQGINGKVLEPVPPVREPSQRASPGVSEAMTIIRELGGVAEVRGEAGKGATFSLYLPAAEHAAQVSAYAPPRARFMGKNRLILLVDDEVAIAELAASVLVDYGFRVLTAPGGLEAEASCRTESSGIDLAIVDMMMPGMDGPATIRALRRLQPDLPFIMTTGLHEGARTEAKFGTEKVTFLVKPFSIEQLLESVEAALAKSSPVPEPEPPHCQTPEPVAA